MKSCYLLLLFTGLFCLGCKKEPDPTTAMFNQITGEYRFTKLRSSSYSNATGSTVTTESTTACDIPVTVDRFKDNIRLIIKGTRADTVSIQLDKHSTDPNYYTFSWSGYHTGNSASFKLGTDSIFYSAFWGGTGGGVSSSYRGKRQ